jgi:hypothetical protein
VRVFYRSPQNCHNTGEQHQSDSEIRLHSQATGPGLEKPHPPRFYTSSLTSPGIIVPLRADISSNIMGHCRFQMVNQMMTPAELQQHLSHLGLPQGEAAQLLSVSPRTVRRWFEGEEVPGPVEQVFRAWLRLHDRNLPWRPDSLAIIEDDQEVIARYRAHDVDLSNLLARVEAREGPWPSWEVDREKRRATVGGGVIEVSYYKLRNGSFSLATYTRKDGNPDMLRDRESIEDAAYCIARELKKEPEFGPVTLVYYDRPGKFGFRRQTTTPDFPSNEAAIQQACQLMGSPNFHSASILERADSDRADACMNMCSSIWANQELLQECQRLKKVSAEETL